jgi:hypothetical protein
VLDRVLERVTRGEWGRGALVPLTRAYIRYFPLAAG